VRTDAFVPTTRAALSRPGRLLFAVLLAALAVGVVFAPSLASAGQTRVFVETFGSAAQPTFEEPDAVAVDQGTGEVYVADSETQTLSRFNANGTPSNFSALGTNVIGGFSFNGFTLVTQIAIDESGPGSPTDGNIYVTQSDEGRIEIFAPSGSPVGQLTATDANPLTTPCGVAVAGNGDVLVGEWGPRNEIHKFEPVANPPVNADYTESFPLGSGPLDGGPCSLALGTGSSAGFLFANVVQEGVAKVDADNGALQYVVDPAVGNSAVAFDSSSGDVLVTGNLLPIREYDASGSQPTAIASFGGGEAIAVDGGSERLYVGSGDQLLVYSPLVPIPAVVTGSATILGLTSARVHGTVTPDGAPIDECFFEYGTTMSYGQTAPCAQLPGDLGSGDSPVPVHADLGGLAQETRYHYRLVASNAIAPAERGADRTFKTPSKPTIVGQWAQDVVFTEATLRAKINPESLDSTYRFEWGPDPSYGNVTVEKVLEGGDQDRTVSLFLDGLEPGATYHWRVVAENEIGITVGPDRAFTTYRPGPAATDCPNQAFRVGSSALLPDCRAYELVSPLDKNNGDIQSPTTIDGYPSAINQSSTSGERFAYSSGTAFGDPASSPFVSQYLAQRVAPGHAGEGWVSEALQPTRTRVVTKGDIPLDNEFKAFSPDLCSGWLQTDYDPPLAAGAVSGYLNLYRRDTCAGGGFEALTTAASDLDPNDYKLRFQAGSADGSRALFVASDNLPGTGAPANPDQRMQLYEHARGSQLRFACILPSGSASQQACYAGTADEDPSTGAYVRQGNYQNAISASGDRFFWTEAAGTGINGRGPGRIYLSGAGAKTRPVSQTVSTTKARFWGASVDGSKAIFGFEESGSPQNGNLYGYDAGTGLPTPIAGGVQGVLGVSDDARVVYFVSNEALTGGEQNSESDQAEAGALNLYMYREGTGLTFVAVLTEFPRKFTPYTQLSYFRIARVSPDGGHLAFMSHAPLTGYDNTDAVSGVPDMEVFLYDAADKRLRCASCNPSGARPFGADVDDKVLLNGPLWVAGQIPGWERPYYASRVLSADGNRLFFESFDALVPRDTNRKMDVYQWEGAGSGGCDTADVAFSAEAEGCIDLISSGESPREARFLDADPSGANVFISTLSSLVPQDYGLVDVYDARVGGGFAPPVAPGECEGEACQAAAAPPAALTPASSSYRGKGNPGRRCPKGKRRVRRKGKVRCVKPRKRASKAKGRRGRGR